MYRPLIFDLWATFFSKWILQALGWITRLLVLFCQEYLTQMQYATWMNFSVNYTIIEFWQSHEKGLHLEDNTTHWNRYHDLVLVGLYLQRNPWAVLSWWFHLDDVMIRLRIWDKLYSRWKRIILENTWHRSPTIHVWCQMYYYLSLKTRLKRFFFYLVTLTLTYISFHLTYTPNFRSVSLSFRPGEW